MKNDQEDFIPAPPEDQAVKEVYILEVNFSDKLKGDSESIKKYATKLLRKKLGDDVDVESVKVTKPGRLSRRISKALNRAPVAKLHIKTKF